MLKQTIAKHATNKKIDELIYKLICGEYLDLTQVIENDQQYYQFCEALREVLGDYFDVIEGLRLYALPESASCTSANTMSLGLPIEALDANEAYAALSNIYKIFCVGDNECSFSLMANYHKAALIKAIIAKHPMFFMTHQEVQQDAAMDATLYLIFRNINYVYPSTKDQDLSGLLSQMFYQSGMFSGGKLTDVSLDYAYQLKDLYVNYSKTYKAVVNDKSMPLSRREEVQQRFFTLQIQMANIIQLLWKPQQAFDALQSTLDLQTLPLLRDYNFNAYIELSDKIGSFLPDMLLLALARIPDNFDPAYANFYMTLHPEEYPYVKLCQRASIYFFQENNSALAQEFQRLAELSKNVENQVEFKRQLLRLASQLRETEPDIAKKFLQVVAANSSDPLVRLQAYEKFVKIRIEMEQGNPNPDQANLFLIQLATQTVDLEKAAWACQILSDSDNYTFDNTNDNENEKQVCSIWQTLSQSLQNNKREAYFATLLKLADIYANQDIKQGTHKAILILHAVVGQSDCQFLQQAIAQLPRENDYRMIQSLDDIRFWLFELANKLEPSKHLDLYIKDVTDDSVCYLKQIILDGTNEDDVKKATGLLKECYSQKIEILTSALAQTEKREQMLICEVEKQLNFRIQNDYIALIHNHQAIITACDRLLFSEGNFNEAVQPLRTILSSSDGMAQEVAQEIYGNIVSCENAGAMPLSVRSVATTTSTPMPVAQSSGVGTGGYAASQLMSQHGVHAHHSPPQVKKSDSPTPSATPSSSSEGVISLSGVNPNKT